MNEIFCINEMNLGEDGWALLMPFGDKEMTTVVANAAEFRKQFPGAKVNADNTTRVVQRCDRAAAEALVNSFNGFAGRVKRFFAGVPLFSGHPDAPGRGHLYPDKGEKGVAAKLDAREGGVFVQPIFNSAGGQLLNGATKQYFSGRWNAEPTGEQTAEGIPIYRPTHLLSIGITPNPNLPTEMLNTADLMERTRIFATLLSVGVSLANDATDAQIETAIKDLGTRAASVVTLQNDKSGLAGQVTERDGKITTLTSERDTLKTDLANARDAHRKDLLADAVATGRITKAEEPRWDTRLKTDLVNEAAELRKLKPQFKTAPVTQGDRRSTPAPAQEAGAQLNSAATTIFNSDPERDKDRAAAWLRAYKTASTQNPALIEALNATA